MFAVHAASGTLPATTVIARTSKDGERRARIKANASSKPGSVSMTTGFRVLIVGKI